MKLTRSGLHCLWIAAVFLFLVSPLNAQIYEPDGLRMPGTWNNWVNTTGMGGDFDLVKQTSGTPRWNTTFNYTGASGTNTFKFVSTSFDDPWGNQWAGNTSVTLNALNDFTYGTPSDPDNSITLTQNKWYSVSFEDLGYQNSRAVFMETSTSPVRISQVTQLPAIVTVSDAVEVTAQLASAPSPEEHFFVRYSTDNWATSQLVSMLIAGNTATAQIPAQASQTEVSYYVLSSVADFPITDTDLLTLRLNNNSGSNYSYTVDQQIECGGHNSLVSTEPAFPLDGQPVTLFFNAGYGNGGLFDYTGDVYAHTGVITNLSVNSSDWKYVKTQWGENTPETLLTRISDNLYSLTIPDIRTYYGVPASEQILKIALVFRAGIEEPEGYYREHKNADGSDIFVDVYPLALNVKILNPARNEPLVSPNTLMAVCAEAMQNERIQLYLDQTLLADETGSSLSYPLFLQGMQPGSYWLKAVALSGNNQARDSVQIYLRGPVDVEPLPAGLKNGINYINNNTVTLVLSDPAALKNFAFAIGEFSNWLPNDANYMKRTPDGRYYWVTLTGLESGREYAYQYYIDGNLKIADAFCEKVLDPWNDRWIPSESYPDLKSYPFDKTTGVVSVFQTAQNAYQWQVSQFTPQAINDHQSDLHVYELLLRDFTDTHNLAGAMQKLDYLQQLGVNAIELMPVAEFDGNESWGYAPNFFMAPDKYYGTRDMYKQFIDACHSRNIAVILDIVTNHAYGLCPMVQMYFDATAGSSGQPSADNPWFNQQAPHPYSIGYDFNHELQATREFIKTVLGFWLTEYKVDGFRFDLSKGLTQHYSGEDVVAWSMYDQSRINIITDYYNHIKSVNPNALVILEHLANNDEEVVLANTGMLLWSAMQEHYKQVGMGWNDNSDLGWAYHANRDFTYPNLMDYMENHDEERLMAYDMMWGNTSGSYNLKDTSDALHHMQMAAVLFMGIPGPKMNWQFGELGYDYSILYNGGRTASKPPRWDYFDQPERQTLYRVYAAMSTLRKSDAFRFGTFTSDLGGNGKRMWISHNSLDVVIAANMGVTSIDMAPGFQHSGIWYDYFNGEQVNIADAAGQTFSFGPGSYRVFTSFAQPRPFYNLTVQVTDSVSGALLASAVASLEGSGSQTTTLSGVLSFTSEPGSYILTVARNGYNVWTRTVAADADKTIEVKLKPAGNIGISDLSLNFASVWPNPAGEVVNISAPLPAHYSLMNPQGGVVLEGTMLHATEKLNLTGLPAAIYLLHVQTPKGVSTLKIVMMQD